MTANMQGTGLALQARTATTSSPAINTNAARGVRVFIFATAKAATPSVVPTIEVKDPVSGEWAVILTGAAITDITAAPVVLTVYPGVTVASNVAVSAPIGKTFRVTMTHGDADSLTYSIGYVLLV